MHICSAHTQERCPACGYEDTRDAFECFVQGDGFAVICRDCDAYHPDQSNHDDLDCDGCFEESLNE